MFGRRVYRTIADVPERVDLVAILTGSAVDTFAEVAAAKAKFAVIFAAGFSEIGKDGEKLEARLRGLVRDGDTHLLGPNTNLNAFESFREDLAPPALALITQSGHQGRGIFQGQELGIAITHWAPTGNEVDLEFADFAKYFVDQPEVGVVTAYIEGFKDGRISCSRPTTCALHRPIVIVKVGRTEGRSMAKATPLTGSDAVTSAMFGSSASPVDGLDELLESRRVRPYEAAGHRRRVHLRSPVAPAPCRTWRRPRARLPQLTKETQRMHDGLIPSYLRVSNPSTAAASRRRRAASRSSGDRRRPARSR